MLCFENDYSEGAHPEILEHLIETNMEQLSGYGTDIYCQKAKEKISKLVSGFIIICKKCRYTTYSCQTDCTSDHQCLGCSFFHVSFFHVVVFHALIHSIFSHIIFPRRLFLCSPFHLVIPNIISCTIISASIIKTVFCFSNAAR